MSAPENNTQTVGSNAAQQNANPNPVENDVANTRLSLWGYRVAIAPEPTRNEVNARISTARNAVRESLERHGN